MLNRAHRLESAHEPFNSRRKRERERERDVRRDTALRERERTQQF